ncbi:hypothetical protein ABVT39_002196 [Epinephelus coioides]
MCSLLLPPKKKKSCQPDEHGPQRHYCEPQGGRETPDNSGLLIDNLDKMTSVYSCKRKIASWPLVIFFNVVDVSAHNAFVLWMEIDPNWNWGKHHRRRLFLEELGSELVVPLINRRKVPPRTPASASLVAGVKQGPSPSTEASPPLPSCSSQPITQEEVQFL